MGHKFTKVLFAVEHDGKAYGVHLPADKLELLLSEAAKLSPSGSLEMYPMPNQQLFTLAVQEDHFQPMKVATPADIPFADHDIVFIDMADKPGREVLSTILRWEAEPAAFCFIGSAPEWGRNLVEVGYSVYELPPCSALSNGQRVVKPRPSSLGVLWLEGRAGEVAA